MSQKSHALFPAHASHIQSEIIELRPQRHLHVCAISRKDLNLGPESHYEDTSFGVTVFLIHGVAGSVEVWRSQIDFLLCENSVQKIVAVDLIGHGRSSAPRDQEAYQFEEIALDVRALFTKFRSNNNVIVGHSYGSVLLVIQRSRVRVPPGLLSSNNL